MIQDNPPDVTVGVLSIIAPIVGLALAFAFPLWHWWKRRNR